MSSLYDEIQEVKAQYPEPRSAIMPALRLAQEQYGWLPPKALGEVAEALDLTPAHVQAVASFYDMYHLAPIGRHLVEICTNLSCALVMQVAVASSATNDGARNFTRHGFGPPSETTKQPISPRADSTVT